VKVLLAINLPLWLYGAAAALQPQTVGEWIVLAGAVVAALGVLRAKVLVPCWDLARKFHAGVDAMLDSPRRFEDGSARMGRIEAEVKALRDEIVALARRDAA
jgi:hypothetical protein